MDYRTYLVSRLVIARLGDAGGRCVQMRHCSRAANILAFRHLTRIARGEAGYVPASVPACGRRTCPAVVWWLATRPAAVAASNAPTLARCGQGTDGDVPRVKRLWCCCCRAKYRASPLLLLVLRLLLGYHHYSCSYSYSLLFYERRPAAATASVAKK